MNSGKYISNIVKADINVALSMSMMEAWNNKMKQLYDQEVPDYYKKGMGKFGVESMFENVFEGTPGLLFATTLQEAFAGAMPIMMKRALDAHRDVDTTREKNLPADQYTLKLFLSGDYNQLMKEAYKEFQKPNSSFGNKDLKIDDIVIGDIDKSGFVVPENAQVQAFGFKAGDPINDLATMRFIEFTQSMEAWKKLST